MTTKSISVERLYSLGDYKNIKISYSMNDLPEDADVERLFKECHAQVELAYLDYRKMHEEARSNETEEQVRNYLNQFLNKETEE